MIIEDIGGTFIKLGQMLSLQPDILPLHYCTALFNLLDRIAPFPFEVVERVFVEELGKGPCELFDRFDSRPIATASIGQVHVAYLAGRKLAVKVQRPSVECDFDGDVTLMEFAVRLVKRFRVRKLYWIIEPVAEFVSWTREELDYQNEARYMEQLRSNARGNFCERVPAVLSDYTTRRILVADFLEGVTMLEYLRALETNDELFFHRLKSTSFEPNQFACNIVDNFLKDACTHGMFHADLHPANLMILPGNVVGYIDFGITGLLSRYSSQNLVTLTLAFTQADLRAMSASFLKGSVMGPNADPEAFHNGLKTLAHDWYETNGKQGRLRKSFTLVMLDMLGLSRKADIWPERDVIKYIRSAIAIDGLISRFAPGFDLGRYLEVVCDRYIKWEGRRLLLTYDTLVEWCNSSSDLMRDGPSRAARFLERICSGQIPISIESLEPAGGSNTLFARKAIGLGAIALLVSLLMTATGERAELGMNLFTAEALLILAAVVMLSRAVHRFGNRSET